MRIDGMRARSAAGAPRIGEHDADLRQEFGLSAATPTRP
jgi:hypothetical protein